MMIILFSLGAQTACRAVVSADKTKVEKFTKDATGDAAWIPFEMNAEQLAGLYRRALSQAFPQDARDTNPVIAYGAERRPNGVVVVEIGPVSDLGVRR